MLFKYNKKGVSVGITWNTIVLIGITSVTALITSNGSAIPKQTKIPYTGKKHFYISI